MECCTTCSSELHGYYEFRDDGSPICLSCFEEYERKVRRETGSMKAMRGDISGPIMAAIAPRPIVEMIADEPPSAPPAEVGKPSRARLAALFASVLVASAIVVAWLV